MERRPSLKSFVEMALRGSQNKILESAFPPDEFVENQRPSRGSLEPSQRRLAAVLGGPRSDLRSSWGYSDKILEQSRVLDQMLDQLIQLSEQLIKQV